jgi:Putative zinc-binding metallo-peptidase
MLPPDWPNFPDDRLLDVRMADLPISIDSSVLASRIEQLRQELAIHKLQFSLHFYLSDEWFTPDGASAIAIPFYLAHPRLEKLEEAQMLEVEGGEHEWCMRILRHESGHAIDNAFKLRLRRQRRQLFGSPSEPYPEFYTPKPYSKSFVLHLDSWYAQSHPDEDFAETFAVWLTPNSEWRQRYAGWPAVKKLDYMNMLMQSLHGQQPRIANVNEIDPLRRIRKTLRQHYRRKRRYYGVDYPNFYDRDLRRLFSDSEDVAGNVTAAQFLGRIRRPVRRLVASWTGIYQYTIDQVLEDMIERCRELKLRLAVPEDQARQEFTVLLTVQTMNYLHSGGHRLML